MDTPQSPEVEVINPRERALAHKAESVGVVALSTVRLGETPKPVQNHRYTI